MHFALLDIKIDTAQGHRAIGKPLHNTAQLHDCVFVLHQLKFPISP